MTRPLRISLKFLLFAGCCLGPAFSQAQGRKPSSDVSQQLPSVMHFCAYNCMTLTLNNGRYDSSFQNGSNFTVIWTVERFSPESVYAARQ